MNTEIIKIDQANIASRDIAKVAQALDNKELIAFPTETVYGIACRVCPDSLKKLDKIKARTAEKHYTLHIAKKTDVAKYIPTMGLRVEKLIKNAWPGPVTIVFQLSDTEIKKQRKALPKTVFQALYRNNTIGIRCPDHPVASQLLQAVKYPVVAPSANLAGQPPATDAKLVIEQFAEKIAFVIDAGPTNLKQSSTVVKIDNKNLEILRQGAYPKEQLQKDSTIQILVVCTGNTCRSAMAEGIFKARLAEKLQCDIDQLELKGYKIVSAGTLGMIGAPASIEAVTACSAKKIDIENHESSALTAQLLKDSDLVFVMGKTHRQAVIGLDTGAVPKCKLLAEEDILDPIGQPQQFYDYCCELIDKAVQKRINELKL